MILWYPSQRVWYFRIDVEVMEVCGAQLEVVLYPFRGSLVRSHEERRCSMLGPTQNRVSPSTLEYTKNT